MTNLEKLINSYIIEYKSNPNGMIIIREDILLESLKEELPFLRRSFKKPITLKLLRNSIASYCNTDLDANEELQDIYDAAFACIYTITKAIWGKNPDDEDEDVNFTSRWSFGENGVISIILGQCE